MNPDQIEQNKHAFIANAVEAVIRIGLLLLLVGWCFDIAKPFLMMIIWGVIIAVASYPLYKKLCDYLSGRHVLASIIFTVTLLATILVPTIILSATAVEGVTDLAKHLNSGEVVIPPPSENVKDWPIVGPPLSDLWTMASENVPAALEQVKPQLKTIGLSLLKMMESAGISLLTFIVAIVMAGFILINASSGNLLAHQFALRIMGNQGYRYVDLSGKIIQSVTQGILGVAIVQSILAGLGFVVMGVPAAGLWAFLCLLLAVIQVGIMPIMIPVVIYVMSTADTLPGIAFLVWSIAVGLIDNILKPILLSRGVDVPMAVVFVGSLGGLLSMGIIGLFVGAVVMALSYSLFSLWLGEDETTEELRT